MPVFNIKGASCTRAATQAFDIQLPGAPVFLNLSQLHKHHAALVLRAWGQEDLQGSQVWAAPLLPKQRVSVDYLIPPPPPSVIEKGRRLISTCRDLSPCLPWEAELMPETENCGFCCWQHALYQCRYDSVALPLTIFIANLALGNTTAK